MRTVRTPENVEPVRQALLRSPNRSARRHSSELGFSNRSLKRILHLELCFRPYKLVVVQQLPLGDYTQRVTFAHEIQAIFEQNDYLILCMSDEAHFHLNGMVIQHNCRYWAYENPKQLYERPLHSPKVTVWCAMDKTGVIDPYFFEDDNAVTVNSECYTEMINNFFLSELRRKRISIRRGWFQQNGATAHSARASKDVIRHLFPGCLISRFGDIHWPSRSPDSSMRD